MAIAAAVHLYPHGHHLRRRDTAEPTPRHLHAIPTPSELKQLHAQLAKTGARLADLPLPKLALACAVSSPSSFDYAVAVLRRADPTPIVAWNSALRALAESDSPADALLLFSRLLAAGVLPDTFTVSFAVKACSKLSAVFEGRAIHALVEKLALGSDDVFLLNTIIHMYASSGEIEVARRLFDVMPKGDVVSWNILVTQYTKIGDMETAFDMFGRMPKRSVRSWTAMIAGCVQCGRPKEAIELYYEMEAAGMKPNEVTVVAVAAACADLGALDLGKRVHEYSNRCGFGKNVRICNTLIDMYIKCGCLEVAERLFDGMTERSVVSWSAMIGGLAIHGRAEEALGLFERMTKIGIRPNAVTYVGVLQACSHMGMVEDGRKYFSGMTRDYGIIPSIEHYGCMVDLLSRSGFLEEAHEFIRNMPIKPSSVVWGALLGGCRLHKNVEIGEMAIKHLQELDPTNDGYYVVLSNIYAELGRWKDVAGMRMLMKERGLRKTPGRSSIAVNGVLHEFVAGDGSHPCSEEIYERWEELLKKIENRGYVPDTSVVLLDMEEEEKVDVVYRHSEKLAVVFGLINTTPGTPIRIMKNLRVCNDCHTALKIISDVEEREIVVRDRNRFHCFKSGSCSCRDYW